MGIAQDILTLFQGVIDSYDGSCRAAAANLGINNVTLWNWVTGKRSLNDTLCKAIDRAGGVLLLPGDARSQQGGDLSQRLEELEKENMALRERVAELTRYQAMWEGHIETVKAQSGAFSESKKVG